MNLTREGLVMNMSSEDVMSDPVIGKFGEIYDVIKSEYKELGHCSENDLEILIENEIRNVFITGLEHSGVF